MAGESSQGTRNFYMLGDSIHHNGSLLSGLWAEFKISWHINRKELFAVYQAFQRALPQLQDRRVIIQSDNKIVMYYIRNQGGTRSSILTDLVANILELAYMNRIETFANYIPVIYNEIADSLSRQKSLADWYLSDQTSLLFILLLASGRRIHDLTLLGEDEDHLRMEDESVTFWPGFGSKTDKSSHRQSGWLLSRSSEKNLDPTFSLA